MYKGLKSTLLTVAVALLGFKAMATAPVIGEIPDVIIGDAETATPANLFVYPDAINLDSYVTDESPATSISWGYRAASGSAQYSINNAPVIAAGAIPATIPAGSNLSLVDTDPAKVDALPRTITFRNTLRSPISGPNTAPTTSEAQVLELIASDGTTASSKLFTVYTDAGGLDQTSTGAAVPTQLVNLDFATGTQGWSYEQQSVFGTGAAASSSSGASGLCVTSSGPGNVMVRWVSNTLYNGTNPYTALSISPNSIYEFRVDMTTNAAAGKVPAIQVGAQNTRDGFGQTVLMIDFGGSVNNLGYGATAPTPGPLSTYVQYYAPAAYESSRFTTGIALPANAAEKDCRLFFGVVDFADPDGYGALNDVGTVCVKKFIVNKYDASALVVSSTVLDKANLADAVETTGAPSPTDGGMTWLVTDFQGDASTLTPLNGATSVNVVGGDIQVRPSTATVWDTNSPFLSMRLGDSNYSAVGGAGNSPADISDNFPILWKANQAYRITFFLKAPSVAAESTGPDAYYFAGYTLTNEMAPVSYITNKFASISMPSSTAETPYSVFFNGNVVSLEPGTYKYFGAFLMAFSNLAFIEQANSNGFDLTRVRVQEVNF